MGAIIPTSSRITKTEGLHFKVGWVWCWGGDGMCVQQMFCFRLIPILFQEDGGYGVEVQWNAEELWEEIGKNGLGGFKRSLY